MNLLLITFKKSRAKALQKLKKIVNIIKLYKTNTKMHMFEDLSKYDVYDKKDVTDEKIVNDETCDEVEDYIYTIVSTNENYVFKVSLYSRT